MSSKINDFSSAYKLTRRSETSSTRVKRRSIEWKNKRYEEAGKRRNLDKMSPLQEFGQNLSHFQNDYVDKTPSKKNKGYTSKVLERKDMLLKWREERKKKQQEEAKKNKPAFKVIHVQHIDTELYNRLTSKTRSSQKTDVVNAENKKSVDNTKTKKQTRCASSSARSNTKHSVPATKPVKITRQAVKPPSPPVTRRVTRQMTSTKTEKKEPVKVKVDKTKRGKEMKKPSCNIDFNKVTTKRGNPEATDPKSFAPNDYTFTGPSNLLSFVFKPLSPASAAEFLCPASEAESTSFFSGEPTAGRCSTPWSKKSKKSKQQPVSCSSSSGDSTTYSVMVDGKKFHRSTRKSSRDRNDPEKLNKSAKTDNSKTHSSDEEKEAVKYTVVVDGTPVKRGRKSRCDNMESDTEKPVHSVSKSDKKTPRRSSRRSVNPYSTNLTPYRSSRKSAKSVTSDSDSGLFSKIVTDDDNSKVISDSGSECVKTPRHTHRMSMRRVITSECIPDPVSHVENNSKQQDKNGRNVTLTSSDSEVDGVLLKKKRLSRKVTMNADNNDIEIALSISSDEKSETSSEISCDNVFDNIKNSTSSDTDMEKDAGKKKRRKARKSQKHSKAKESETGKDIFKSLEDEVVANEEKNNETTSIQVSETDVSEGDENTLNDAKKSEELQTDADKKDEEKSVSLATDPDLCDSNGKSAKNEAESINQVSEIVNNSILSEIDEAEKTSVKTKSPESIGETGREYTADTVTVSVSSQNDTESETSSLVTGVEQNGSQAITKLDRESKMDQKSDDSVFNFTPVKRARRKSSSSMEQFREPEEPMSARKGTRKRRKTTACDIPPELRSPDQWIEVLATSPMIEMSRRTPKMKTPPGKHQITIEPINFDDLDDVIPDVVKPDGETGVNVITDNHVSADKTFSVDPSTDVNTQDVSKEAEESSGEHDVKYFRDLLLTETARLQNSCLKWETMDHSDSAITEETEGQIRTVIGQAQLLVDQRFKQFRGLVDDCEFKRGERETTCSDLQGFWDMIYYQVKDVDKKFEDLQKQKDKNWVTENVVPKKKILKKKPVAAKPAKSVASKFAGFRAEMKKKKIQSVIGGNSRETDDTFKVFDAGFFKVHSPIKSRASLTPVVPESKDECESDVKMQDTELKTSANSDSFKKQEQVSRPSMSNVLQLTATPNRRSYAPPVPSPLLKDITPKHAHRKSIALGQIAVPRKLIDEQAECKENIPEPEANSSSIVLSPTKCMTPRRRSLRLRNRSMNEEESASLGPDINSLEFKKYLEPSDAVSPLHTGRLLRSSLKIPPSSGKRRSCHRSVKFCDVSPLQESPCHTLPRTPYSSGSLVPKCRVKKDKVCDFPDLTNDSFSSESSVPSKMSRPSLLFTPDKVDKVSLFDVKENLISFSPV